MNLNGALHQEFGLRLSSSFFRRFVGCRSLGPWPPSFFLPHRVVPPAARPGAGRLQEPQADAAAGWCHVSAASRPAPARRRRRAARRGAGPVGSCWRAREAEKAVVASAVASARESCWLAPGPQSRRSPLTLVCALPTSPAVRCSPADRAFCIMCGIFAYLNYHVPRTRREILETLIKGLQRLEYRGYDSAGVGVDGGNDKDWEANACKIQLIKKKGNLAGREKEVKGGEGGQNSN
ncbi:uncharacterized protein LOC116877088 [Lontra canadensis]|uniref:uncharacterized protein LOC116877088 n=1 Tax=Lontra canadensis TaxID=76717 RepID=UPI0013F38DF9|nr:uncharacterized protein LOC116877088 [Lontra canadensis]